MPKQAKWRSFPHPNPAFSYEGVALKKHWHKLHRGDCEPFPDAAALKKLVESHPALKPAGSLADCAAKLEDAWRAYHRGNFQEAVETGFDVGPLGYNAANKAANIYATYLEEDKDRRLAIFQDVIHRAEKLQAAAPELANAWYFYAQALGRYSQAISVAKALAEGLGGKVKSALEQTLKLAPQHADAHIALGAYHANVVNKMGGLAARLTFGASKEEAIRHFEEALQLNPGSAIAKIEFANGLAMLFGKAKLAEATKLYEEAAAVTPADAMDMLDVELAKEEISG
jgi:tetratricopeptide (TPR) repeat protein